MTGKVEDKKLEEYENENNYLTLFALVIGQEALSL